jgi:pimeloyl-ACP methyl ester carboxylesterase
MGGLIGMAVCGTPGCRLPAPVRRLVLNDVGPAIQWQALQRIGTYLGQHRPLRSVQQAADAMWAISQSFGPHTPEQWLALSRPMVRRVAARPAASRCITTRPSPCLSGTKPRNPRRQGQAALWQLYDAIRAARCCCAGQAVRPARAPRPQAMTQRGPRAELVEFAGVGHAPTLIAPDQVEAVTSFLLHRLSEAMKSQPGVNRVSGGACPSSSRRPTGLPSRPCAGPRARVRRAADRRRDARHRREHRWRTPMPWRPS